MQILRRTLNLSNTSLPLHCRDVTYTYICRRKNVEKYKYVTSLKEMRCANEKGNLIYVAVKLKSLLGMYPAHSTCTRIQTTARLAHGNTYEYVCLYKPVFSFIAKYTRRKVQQCSDSADVTSTQRKKPKRHTLKQAKRNKIY